MSKQTSTKILILAGGRGTRLWPISRKQKPKQFQRLIGEKTMLQETVSRFLPMFSPKNIFISTNKEYIKETKKELSEIPKNNIIAEPVSRERIAAICLFISRIKKEEFDKPIIIAPSDHIIKKGKKFRDVISAGEKFVKENSQYITILGAKPSFPDTGLGYIKKGKLIKKTGGLNFHQVDFFKEKPNLQRTRKYLKDDNYLWNTGIYIFTPSLMEKAVKDFALNNYKIYKKIKLAAGKDKRNYSKTLRNEYPSMESLGLEYEIFENYNKVAVIPVDVGWSDVGSWSVLKNVLSSPNKNYIKGNCISIDSKNVMIYSSSNKQLVASLCVKDLVIVVTDDIIMICDKKNSQKVKQLTQKLEKQKKFNYI